ncbi:hypothetical protein BZU22_12865 [Salmonella enterica subsp. enterica serovar Pomona]|nr:hypothetical protein [Salmonella enterica subsp. enterica serovar Pomona]
MTLPEVFAGRASLATHSSFIGWSFSVIFSGLPATEQHKIANFISHVKKDAWKNLEGRNKKSDDINPASPDYWKKIAFVNQFNLWHYHIGIKQYNLSKKYGDRTSRFVLHYMRKLEQVKIVDMSEHPPFILPTQHQLH